MSVAEPSGKRKIYSCSYCYRDVTAHFRVQCAVCAAFYLCLDCFSAGVTLDPHESNHDYKISDCWEMPIFEKGWSVNDELILLDAIEKYGVGNWKTISEAVFANRTTRQIEEHYWELYMGVHGCCLPPKTIMPDGTVVDTASFFPSSAEETSSNVVSVEDSTNTASVEMNGDGAQKVKSENGNAMRIDEKETAIGASADSSVDQSETAPAQTAPVEKHQPVKYIPIESHPLELDEPVSQDDLLHINVVRGYAQGEVVRRDIGREFGIGPKAKSVEKQTVGDKLATLTGSDLLGYTPLREDFDIEFENDAEMMLQDMDFNTDDHPSERDLKLQIIGIYNRKLEERDKRKRFVIERNLIDFKNMQNAERRRTKEEKELAGKLRVYARFQEPAEHEAMLDGIFKARKLRDQILLYKEYRKMGIRTLEQAKQYEADKKIKNHNTKSAKQGGGMAHLQTGRNSDNQWMDFSQSSAHSGNGRRSMGGEDTMHHSASQISMASGNSGTGGKRKSRGGHAVEDFTVSFNTTDSSVAGDDDDGPTSTTAVTPATVKKRGRKSFKEIEAAREAANAATAAAAAAATAAAATGAPSLPPLSVAAPTPAYYGCAPQQVHASTVGALTGISSNYTPTVDDLNIIRNAPRGDLLSDAEIHLCARVPMLPLHYLAAKDVIVREAYRNGQLTPDGMKRVLKMDPRSTTVIYDFFIKEMLINDPTQHANAFKWTQPSASSSSSSYSTAAVGGAGVSNNSSGENGVMKTEAASGVGGIAFTDVSPQDILAVEDVARSGTVTGWLG